VTASNLQIEVGEPFFIAGTDHGVGVYAFPWTYRMPNGDVILSVRLDRDQTDARRILLRSADAGKMWTEDFLEQSHVDHPEYAALDQSTVLCVGSTKCYESRQPEHFVFPYWVSEDGGRSFGAARVGSIHVPGATARDPYDMLSERSKNAYTKGFLKGARPPLPTYLEPMVRSGTLRRGPCFEKVIAQADGTLLGVGPYLVAGDQTLSMAVFRSGDRGRTWGLACFAARDPRVNDGSDGLCEPAIVQFGDGELFCVMRSGSYRALYSIRSTDGGQTWSGPEALPVEGVMPILVLMTDGTLALATGRPDNVLCLSADGGRTWPKRIVIQEWAGVENDKGEIVRRDRPNVPPDNPDLHSTGYNGLAEVEPGRLLYVHDCFSPDEHKPDRWLKRHGHGRIFGRYVTVRKCKDPLR